MTDNAAINPVLSANFADVPIITPTDSVADAEERVHAVGNDQADEKIRDDDRNGKADGDAEGAREQFDRAWELLAGPTRTSLSSVSTTTRTGFETAIATTDAGPFYEVKALGAGGAVLKTSAVVRAHG